MSNLSGSTTAVFVISLSAALETPVTVAWNTKDGTAKAGTDYEATSGSVTFEPGETQKQIQVVVYGRAAGDTQSRTFGIELYPPENAILDQTLTEIDILVTDESGTAITSLVVATGPRGVKGDPGLSAYELAKLQGFSGTLSDWINSQNPAAAILTKTIRVPDATIPDMPPLEDMEGKLLAFSGGKPIGILPESGSAADVMLELAKPSGGDKVNIGSATLTELDEGNIFSKMTRADINTMLNTSGAEVAVDYALQAIIDAGYKSVRFPHTVKGIYTLNGSVVLPGGFTIYGECSKPYTVSGDSSFVGKGTVIRKASGADYIFGPGSTFRIYGCIFDGRDKTRPFINNTNQLRGGILYNCGLYRFLYGVGSYGYTSIQVGRSSICANTIGIRNLIDSKIIDVVINTQSSHAVDLQTGANNNIFVNVRNEWNDGVGYNIYGSVGNIITGELVDRNGSANFVIRNGGGAIIGNLFSQRPGRLSAEGALYNTHFYIEGSGSYLMLSNVKTTKGVDDGGTGTLTPERVITTGGTATDMTVQATGCDLTGYTVSALREAINIDNKLFRNNLGVSDTVTTGQYQLTAGRQNIGGAKTNQVLSSGVGSTLTVTFADSPLNDPTANPIPRPRRRTLLIEANTSAGVVSSYDLGLLIRRISSNAAISTLSGKEFSSPSGLFGVSGATGVTVSTSVNADGSLITVKLTSVDGVGRFIDLTLLPQ